MPIIVIYEGIGMAFSKSEHKKVQGIIGEMSFSIVLPKQFAVNLE
jgi:hypothetical protein